MATTQTIDNRFLRSHRGFIRKFPRRAASLAILIAGTGLFLSVMSLIWKSSDRRHRHDLTPVVLVTTWLIFPFVFLLLLLNIVFDDNARVLRRLGRRATRGKEAPPPLPVFTVPARSPASLAKKEAGKLDFLAKKEPGKLANFGYWARLKLNCGYYWARLKLDFGYWARFVLSVVFGLLVILLITYLATYVSAASFFDRSSKIGWAPFVPSHEPQRLYAAAFLAALLFAVLVFFRLAARDWDVFLSAVAIIFGLLIGMTRYDAAPRDEHHPCNALPSPRVAGGDDPVHGCERDHGPRSGSS